MGFSVRVDVTNPGQFFACCGLFELVARMDGDAEAAFDHAAFLVRASYSLNDVINTLTSASFTAVDQTDEFASAIRIGDPFNVCLDWWRDTRAGGKDLKTWAGSMQVFRIALAMVGGLREQVFAFDTLFDLGKIVYDPSDLRKKVEPYYFDSRRTSNAHSRDVGFSPNDLGLTTTAYPAVEALCLVGLQRFRPRPTERRRWFEYNVWSLPVPISVAGPIAAGAIHLANSKTYRFETWYRTGQKKHKAFRTAVPTNGE